MRIYTALHRVTPQRTAPHCNTPQHTAIYRVYRFVQYMHSHSHSNTHMGWLRLVGSSKLYVSLAEYSLFYRALFQKRPILLGSLLIVATTYLCHRLFISAFAPQHASIHWKTLQHPATPCNTLQHPATPCNTLQHTAAQCSTLKARVRDGIERM